MVSYAVRNGQATEISLYDPGNLLAVVGGSSYQRGGFAVNDGAWHHVAWTWNSADGGVSKLYKDGKLMKTSTGVGSGHIIDPSSAGTRRHRNWRNRWQGYPVMGYLFVGGYQSSYGSPGQARQMLDGDLAMVKIWRTERTAEQVLLDMTSTSASGDMAAFYRFDAQSGRAFGHDYSGGDLHLAMGNVAVKEMDVDLSATHGTKSKWRISNSRSTRCWNLCSLQFFSDSACADEIKGGSPIESGHSNSNTATKATTDGRGGCGTGGVALNDRFWSPGCNNRGTMAPKTAWIGLEWPTPQSVKCVRLAQYPVSTAQVDAVTVQYYDADSGSWKTEWEASGVKSDGDFVENSFNDATNAPVIISDNDSGSGSGDNNTTAADADSGDKEQPDLKAVKMLPLTLGPAVDDESQFEDVVGNLKPIEDTRNVNWEEVTSCNAQSVQWGVDPTMGGKNITGNDGPGFECQQALRKYLCQMQFQQCVALPPNPSKPDEMKDEPADVNNFILEPKTEHKGPCRATCEAVNKACNMGSDDPDRISCDKLPQTGCIGNLNGMGDFDISDAMSPRKLVPSQINAPKVASDDNQGHDPMNYRR